MYSNPFSRSMIMVMLSMGTIAAAAPLGTAFTYQGRLEDNGLPANGMYDFTFHLFDAANLGVQIGSTVTVGDKAVVDGLFTVSLDFGAAAFDGNARWLEVRVRPGDSVGAYTTLTPRQPITAAPYSLFAMSSAQWKSVGGDITNANSGFVGINRTSQVTGNEHFGIRAPVNSGYGGMYISTDGAAGQPFYGYHNGVDSMWTYYEGSTGRWHVNNGGNRLTVTGAGNVGIGTVNPAARLDVRTTSGPGIEGTTTGAFSFGVRGVGTSAGVRGESGASGGAGVSGSNNTTGGTGVEGTTSGNAASGVAGYGNFGTGVYGQSFFGFAVYGTNGGSNVDGYAGYFNGRAHVAGQLSKSSGSFKIDHPLDPANKYLYHSFVESPDMMNIYNGNAVTDDEGFAVVELPEWFEALNQDFRYQLTVIGTFAHAIVAEEIAGNQFTIRTDKPGVKVSWQVTGVRHDAYAQAHRIQVEEDKPASEKGTYLHPELFGADDTQSVDHMMRARERRGEQSK